MGTPQRSAVRKPPGEEHLTARPHTRTHARRPFSPGMASSPSHQVLPGGNFSLPPVFPKADLTQFSTGTASVYVTTLGESCTEPITQQEIRLGLTHITWQWLFRKRIVAQRGPRRSVTIRGGQDCLQPAGQPSQSERDAVRQTPYSRPHPTLTDSLSF